MIQEKIWMEDLKTIYSQKISWKKLKNKSVLVTGANGMLAAYVVYMLWFLNECYGYHIRILVLVRNREEAEKKFHFIDCEYLVQDVCQELVVAGPVDYILHGAGNASPKAIGSDPVGIIRANTVGTMNVMELARKKGAKKVLYLSTREVYGKLSAPRGYIEEGDMGVLECHEKRACYPESKRMGETICCSYRAQFGVPYTIVRIAHAYGPGMKIREDGRIMADLISDLVNDRNLVLKSNGTEERAFCYGADAVAGMFLALLDGAEGEIYNIANESEPLLLKDLAQKLVSFFPEKHLKVVFEIPKERNELYSAIGRTRMDTGKLSSLGWECRVNLEEGVKRTIESFCEKNNE